MRAQIKVVCGQIGCRAVRRPRALGRLQRRLDDADNADRHLLLQFKYVFERTVKAVGPKMRAGFRFDQLRGDAHPARHLF